jgi:hypothetical protein
MHKEHNRGCGSVCTSESGMCGRGECAVQMLREAASRGGHMAHAAGTSPPPPTAPLGASGAETIKEFEVLPSLYCAYVLA